MSEIKKENLEPSECTHDCSSCGKACGDEVPKKDFFTAIEDFVKETEKEEIQDKEAYYNEIINTIIRIGRRSSSLR